MSGVDPSETDVTSRTTHRDVKFTLSVSFFRERVLPSCSWTVQPGCVLLMMSSPLFSTLPVVRATGASMERAGCGSLSSCARTKCAGTGKLSAALILQTCRGGTGLATHPKWLVRLTLSKCLACPRMPGSQLRGRGSRKSRDRMRRLRRISCLGLSGNRLAEGFSDVVVNCSRGIKCCLRRRL